MTLIKNYLVGLANQGKREDGRVLSDYRTIDVQTGVVASAAGSARIKMGGTDILVGVHLSVGVPFPDSPDEGILIVNSELSPLANKDFELGPPRENSIELARVVDRMVREARVIDMPKLCIKKKEKVWTVFIDIYPLNADGNLFDVAALGAMAALKSAVFPIYDDEEGVKFGEYTKQKLPMKTEPMLCTFCKLGDKILLDPTIREEESSTARISIATTSDKHVHDMQKGGEGTFAKDEIFKIVDIAFEKGNELRKLLK